MRTLSRGFLLAVILIACVGCDQVSKVVARQFLPGVDHSYLADTVRLEYAENPGAFLSLGAALPPDTRHVIFTLSVAIILILIFLAALLAPRLGSLQRLALTAICAGGAGNLIDRIRYDGRVTDFLNLGIGSLRTGIFNVADMTLMLGLALLLWGRREIFNKPPSQR